MKRRSSKIVLTVFAIAVCSLAVLPLHSTPATALTITTPGSEWDVGWFHGYFNSEAETCGGGFGCGAGGSPPGPYCNYFGGQCTTPGDTNDVLPPDSGCGADKDDAIPWDCVAGKNQATDDDKVDSLINYLEGLNHGGDGGSVRARDDAGFIYDTLNDEKATDGGKARIISDGDWGNLGTLIKNLLADGQITINWNEYTTTWYNTYATYLPDGNGDVTYYCAQAGSPPSGCSGGGGAEQGDAIVFYSGANPIYVIFRSCANPGGDMDGLPALENPGKYSASTSASPAQVTLGQTITFDNFITVSNYEYSDNVGWSVQRTINGVNSGAAKTGTLTTSRNGTFDVYGAGADDYTPNASTPLGSKICTTMSIDNPPPNDEVGTRTSTSCATVLAQPYLTVTGNDVWTGSNFDYNDNTCQGDPGQPSAIKAYSNPDGTGSFGQFAVFALGSITGFGSAGNTDGDNLTYANTPSDGNYGPDTTFTRCIDDYYNAVGHSANDPGATFGVNSLANVTNATSGLYYHNGNVTINASTMTGGVHAAVVVNGNVTIKGNITYPATYTSLNDIPSLWIISDGDINIQDSVGTITGFYVAEGKSSGTNGIIQTCVDPNAPEDDTTTYNPLTTAVCNGQLTVDGALLAKQIYWQRTDGTAYTGEPPAEQIEFSPELYLESPLMATTPSGGLTTTDLTQLPPVF